MSPADQHDTLARLSKRYGMSREDARLLEDLLRAASSSPGAAPSAGYEPPADPPLKRTAELELLPSSSFADLSVVPRPAAGEEDESATLSFLVGEPPTDPGHPSPSPPPPAGKAARPAPPEKPASIGGYLDLGELGRGGMGAVRRVRDPNLNRVMALKMLLPEVMGEKATVIRFIEEAQVTSQLQHPGIVPVHELGQLPDGRFYFTMKEIQGQTLWEVNREVHFASNAGVWRTSASGWTFRRLIEVFRKVCETVAYAHTRGVIHRDLKSSNVMVGDFGEVLVLDWGLAKVQGRPDRQQVLDALQPVVTLRTERDEQLTQMGNIGGTAWYMSPEQARGDVTAMGPRADVYALGAMLYELLCGRFPYAGFEHDAVIAEILKGPPPPPRQIRSRNSPPIPEALEAICRKAMERDPRRRYRDAGRLAETIGAWLEGAQAREAALAIVAEADPMLPEAEALRSRARALRAEAEAALKNVPGHAPVREKRAGWGMQDDAERLERRAEGRELEYVQKLHAALNTSPDLTEAHARLADYYQAQHADAEARRDRVDTVRAEALLRAHDRGRYAAYLEGDGAVTLHTDPPGAEVRLFRYEDQDRRSVPLFLRSLGYTPLLEVPLRMGSYLLRVKAPGRPEIAYPVALGRQEHWLGAAPGTTEPLSIPLPRTEDLGPQDLYVPAGWSWSGGDPEAPGALPRRRVWVEGFVMQRFPVTVREYMAFLEALLDQGRVDEMRRYIPRSRQEDRAGSVRELLASLQPPSIARGDLPVTNVDHAAAVAYARWMGEKAGVPWRLPGELEWEKAARGVDGRAFPWGDTHDPTWCCMQDSHPSRPALAEIHRFPVDESPYGVRGLAGNIGEWCQDQPAREGPPVERDRVAAPGLDTRPGVWVTRGGLWRGRAEGCRAAARHQARAEQRSDDLGFRLVRSWPVT